MWPKMVNAYTNKYMKGSDFWLDEYRLLELKSLSTLTFKTKWPFQSNNDKEFLADPQIGFTTSSGFLFDTLF